MSELRESLNKLIRDILGDFPQGFNAGVVAGVPGWAGDMAYLAQEYPRALLTDTPLKPPVEYAGTTDSIAKAAGYEIPGTFSGQLGAAVGGLLSPGPGDLAKFAPLVSAIPFWHGSPHKFDAFDLSKMGTGEGAQAYGWGAYGADARDVADQYRINLAYNPDEMRIGGKQINDYYSQIESRAAQMPPQKAQREYDKLSVIERLMGHATLGDAEKYADEVGVGDWFRKEVAPSYSTFGNLYRGEYAWPDPAKEAATPLTGEDLLQWDKPLSEQPENVKNAFKRRITEPKAIDGMDMGGNARLRDNRQGQADPTQSQPWVLETVSSNGTVRFGLSQKDVDRLIGGQDVSALTGAQVYQRIAAEQGGFPQASKMMNDLGIPGIRYLDGMSRDGGSGTYNYVMFDDKGIKLLERNGKPIAGLLDKKR